MWEDKVIEGSRESACLWEILVPTEKRNWNGSLGNKFYTTRYHRVWDEMVRAISGGLTVLPPARGQWMSPVGELYNERMIPVRIIATRSQIEAIIDLTMEYYDQLAILCYKLSDEVILRERK
jgi:hypothetical protein